MNRSRWAIYGLSLTAAVLFAGCGGVDGPARYPVSGKVTFQGEPAAGGTINFFRKETGPVAAPIKDDGTYDFEDNKGGLTEGEYQVFILPPPSITEAPGPGQNVTEVKEFPNFPVKYREFATSGFTAKVEPNSEGNTFDFEMTP